MEALWKLERAHRVIEKFGGGRQQRVFTDQIAGEPAIFTTSFDGQNLKVDEYEALPARLAGPICRLTAMRDRWLDVLPNACSQRQHNIIVAVEYQQRFTRMLRRRALQCNGTRYLLMSLVDTIIGAMQIIANYPSKVDGIVEDRVFAEAGLRITELLRSAGCGYRQTA